MGQTPDDRVRFFAKPMSNRKTRDRQLAKLHARRQAERSRQKRQRWIAIAVSVVVVVAAGVFVFLAFGGNKTPAATPSPTSSPGANCGFKLDKAADTGKKKLQPIPKFTIDVNKTYTATVVTSMGTFKALLYPKDAPCTVNNFVTLARKGFYDGLTFHRIIPDFVIQGGDPAGTGAGNPGYKFADELNNNLKYKLGTLAMANSGPNTNGSQFFVVTGPQGVSLPKKYTIFGQVSSNMNVVLNISRVPTIGGSDIGTKDKPKKPVIIKKITIQTGG
ncbi:MAG TPA: peptidylprolyl isomerase [Actinomycetota bacterium]